MQIVREIGLGSLLLALASVACAAAQPAVLSGVVRDTQGVAQMGATVEVLAAGSARVAFAFTDMSGRYRIANLLPGSYQIRATAALLLPATRRNLRLSTGMRATVNLTLGALSLPTSWLPAERRKADEPGDDWIWTLRSSANRPILRMLGDGEIVTAEAPRRTPLQARVVVMGGDGGFGEGGIRNAVTLERGTRSTSAMEMRASVAALSTAAPGSAVPIEIDAAYERSAPFQGATRLAMSFASHPELIRSGASGMLVMRMTGARKIQLGDAVDVEAGGTVYAIHTAGDVLTAQPFLHVTVHPGEVWAVRYRLATARDAQSFDGLDSIATDLPVAALNAGQLRTEKGSHQEIAVSRRAGRGIVEAAVYHDAIARTAVAGTGTMSEADLAAGTAPNGVVMDTATESFRLLAAGYKTSGVRVSVSQPLTANWRADVAYEYGAGLSTQGEAADVSLPQIATELRAQTAGSVTAMLSGHLVRTGTRVSAAYCWQPQHLVTAVDPYAALAGQAYLGFYVRQAMRWGDRLPPGIEATIDVSNLLAEGYRPFLSADGRTLFLAETPRTVQGGLSFTF